MKKIKFILPLFILPYLTSCGSENTENKNATENEKNSMITILTLSQFERGKMVLGTFEKRIFHSIVKANGVLDVPPENKSTVSAYFGGYVKSISLLQGQKVTKGQVLFILENPDYIQIQQDFLESKSQLSYLESDYERQKELASNNVSSQKTFLKAEADYKSTLAKYESLKKKLQLMNINPSSVNAYNLNSTIAVEAPISGYVTSVLATKGMFLNPSDIALTIMNTDHMHVELNIFEQDLAQVSVGQELSFSIQNGKHPYKANVHLINKAIDPEKRTVKVHCHFSNNNDALSLTPGMYVEADIYGSSDSSFALPVNAVVSIENKSYVLVKKDNAKDSLTFERVEVNTGRTYQGYIEIVNASDFGPALEILTSGAFNLIRE